MKVTAIIAALTMLIYSVSPLLHEMVHAAEHDHACLCAVTGGDETMGCCVTTDADQEDSSVPEDSGMEGSCCSDPDSPCQGHCRCMHSITQIFMAEAPAGDITKFQSRELMTAYYTNYHFLFPVSVWQPPRKA